MSETAQLVQRLEQLDTCAVSDALDSVELPAAAVGIVPLTIRRRIAGPAATFGLGPTPPRDRPKRHLGTATIAAARAGDVIVIAHSSGIECAGWGGVLSAGASVRGVRGIVMDGPARDIDEARALDFPVYATGPIARTARGRAWEKSHGEPVTVAGIVVTPGDLVLADSSGVVFVPIGAADEVITRAERITRRERLMVEALQRGDDIVEVAGRDYEEMLDRLD